MFQLYFRTVCQQFDHIRVLLLVEIVKQVIPTLSDDTTCTGWLGATLLTILQGPDSRSRVTLRAIARSTGRS